MQRAHAAFLLCAVFAAGILAYGCAGVASSNVGEPSGRTRFDFRSKLEMLHVGMPADSLELLFEEAREAGQAGILHKARVITAEFERVTFSLGWKSDPRHQIGVKAVEEIDVERASVIAENSRLIAITIHD